MTWGIVLAFVLIGGGAVLGLTGGSVLDKFAERIRKKNNV